MSVTEAELTGSRLYVMQDEPEHFGTLWRKFLLCSVGVGTIIGMTNTVLAPTVVAAPMVGSPGDTATSGVYSAIGRSEGTLRSAEAIRSLRRRSGLTWDELARIFGVSRRAVHNWANGARMNSFNAARLEELTRVIQEIDHGVANPTSTRADLMTPGPSGKSLYGSLADAARRTARTVHLESRIGISSAGPEHRPPRVLDVEAAEP